MTNTSKRLHLACIGVLTLLILAIAPAAATFAQADTVDFREGVLETARADGKARVIINLNTDVAALGNARAQTSIAAAQASVLAALGTNTARTEGAFRSANFNLIRQYESVPGLAGEITAAGLTALASHPNVASIQLDEMGTGGLAEARTIINADDVITNLGVTGEGIKIAVVDSGIDTDHVFLSDDINQFGICYTNNDCAPNNTSNSNNPEDESGHGTATSGVITSSSGAHPGIAPDVVIVPVRVLDSQNVGFVSDWVAGLDWIIVNQGGLGVDVVNISIQSDAVFSAACDAVYPSLTAAVNQLVNAGIPVVSITGNYGDANSISAPGCLSNTIAVGATYDFTGNFESMRCNDPNAQIDKVACFTNSGNLMDLLAPGATISAPQFNTAQNSVWSGTSVAGPMVAATAAMLLDINPALTPAQIESILKETGVPVTDARNGQTYPRIDALAAVATQLQGVELIGPDGTVFTGTPVFQWEDQPSSPRFRVQVRNIAQDTITLDTVVDRAGLCNGSICAGELGGFLLAGSNQWRVQTYATNTTPAVWSNWMSFNAAAPIIQQPVEDSTVNTANPTITWEELDGATWYQMYIGGPFADLTFDDYLEWHEASTICTDGTCSVTPAGIVNQRYDGENFIYVQGWVNDELGVWAGPRTFTVDAPAPPPAVIEDITDTDTLTPTYSWTLTGNNAVYVRLTVSDSDGLKVFENWYERGEVCGTIDGVNCELTSPETLDDGESYNLVIGLWGPGGLPADAGPEAFDINLEAPVTPTGLSVNVNRGDPTFTWVNDPAAEWFQLVITRSNNSEALNQWYQRGDGVTCGDLVCSLTPNTYLVNDTYTWSLRTWGNGSLSPATAQGIPIELNLDPPVPPNVVDMDTLRVNNEVWQNEDRFFFQWPDVDDAAWYNVEIRTPDDQQLYNQWHRRTDICDGTCEIYPIIYFINGNDYEWQVRAWGPGDLGLWSNIANFTVDGGPQNNAPNLSTATPTGTITTNHPTFIWPTRTGTTWVQIIVERVGQGDVYNAWFETNNLGCGDGIGNCTLDQEALGGLELLDGSYTYQLRFYGPAGISPFSGQRGFVVDAPLASQVQTILAPADDATVTGSTATFQWNASANTTYYRLNLTDTETNQTTETWHLGADLGCDETGDVCTLTTPIATGVYEWSLSTWGPGTMGTTSFATTTPRTITVLN